MPHFPCPHCQKDLKAKADDTGRRCRCGGCGETFIIPAFRDVPRGGAMIPMLRIFLLIAAVFFTAATVLLELYVLVMLDSYDARKAFGADKPFVVGFLLGAWFSIMVNLIIAYALTEIAKAIRERNGGAGTSGHAESL
jgi:hypothetical protein